MPEQPPPDFPKIALEAAKVFRPAAPVNERDLFAGRTKQLRLVLDAVSQQGQHVVIFGERGVGKTSLANVLPDFIELLGMTPTICRKINCDTTDSFDSVWRKIFKELSFPLTRAGMGFSAADTTEYVRLVDQLPKRLAPDDVRATLQFISGVAQPILIIDEFDRIKTENSALFADTIKTLSDQSMPATVILVGVADSVDDLIREHQSIERAMVQILMPRMSPDEIYQIINNGLERIGMTILKPGLDQIGSLAQGLPHYAHLLGLHSSRAALDDEHMEINLKHVERAIRNSTEGAQQSIRTAYTKAISSPRSENLYRQVLLACALAPTDDLGYFSAADVRIPMTTIMGRYYDIPSFARHLKEFSELLRGEILSKTGPERRIRYRFVNPLMQPYVIMRGVSDGLISRENLAKVRSR